ncbi:MAG: hypothetical protein JXA25_08890 [Anaerolineales bacterium]|nr:hypothetical protein [Anaerolineales bacterium]
MVLSTAAFLFLILYVTADIPIIFGMDVVSGLFGFFRCEVIEHDIFCGLMIIDLE